jgi:hypothetical protein
MGVEMGMGMDDAAPDIDLGLDNDDDDGGGDDGFISDGPLSPPGTSPGVIVRPPQHLGSSGAGVTSHKPAIMHQVQAQQRPPPKPALAAAIAPIGMYGPDDGDDTQCGDDTDERPQMGSGSGSGSFTGGSSSSGSGPTGIARSGGGGGGGTTRVPPGSAGGGGVRGAGLLQMGALARGPTLQEDDTPQLALGGTLGSTSGGDGLGDSAEWSMSFNMTGGLKAKAAALAQEEYNRQLAAAGLAPTPSGGSAADDPAAKYSAANVQIGVFRGARAGGISKARYV